MKYSSICKWFVQPTNFSMPFKCSRFVFEVKEVHACFHSNVGFFPFFDNLTTKLQFLISTKRRASMFTSYLCITGIERGKEEEEEWHE